MPIDMNQFIPTFIEESLEMLQDAEKVLVSLDISIFNSEKINRIFRCMHSIKGSSAAFNFTPITDLAHIIENYLDRIRSEEEKLDQAHVEKMLKAIDCIREYINNIKNKKPLDITQIKTITNEFNAKVPTVATESISNAPKTKLTEDETISQSSLSEKKIDENKLENKFHWTIEFNPHKDLFQKGYDPTRLFKVIEDMGRLDVRVNIQQLPFISKLKVTECYLTWTLELKTNSTKEEVEDVFKWVVDDDSIEITAEHKAAQVQASLNHQDINSSHSNSVKISTEKLDKLINIVGELIISQSVLNEIGSNFNLTRLTQLHEGLATLEQHSRELQANVMRIRMIPIEFIFNRFPRMVHDTAQKLGKKVELVMTGEQTELDKNMTDKLYEPLMHLIRNSLDHGIENAERRISKNKNPVGLIQLNAYQDGSNIIIDVVDDGDGLDFDQIRKKAIQLNLLVDEHDINNEHLKQILFKPGFTTSNIVNDISGRGVGLDVVSKNIQDLNGDIEIETTVGVGSTFRIRLPLTLAIMDCQLTKVGSQLFILPLTYISEIIKIKKTDLKIIDNENLVYLLRGQYIPLIYLREIFTLNVQNRQTEYLIVIKNNEESIGFVVDELLSQQQVVIKNIETNYKKIPGISGVSILGDGSIAFIVDPKSVIRLSQNAFLVEDHPQVPLLLESDEVTDSTFTSKENLQFLSFMIGDQEYGVDILSVKEIRKWEQAVPLPNTPAYIQGIINIRGEIIPIIDLCKKFSLSSTIEATNRAIITLEVEQNQIKRCIGFIVDQVKDTYTIPNSELRGLSENTHSPLISYIEGLVIIGKKMITLLKTKGLISVAITE